MGARGRVGRKVGGIGAELVMVVVVVVVVVVVLLGTHALVDGIASLLPGTRGNGYIFDGAK